MDQLAKEGSERRRVTVTSEGNDRLSLRELCQRVVNDLWVPDHRTTH